MRSKRYGPSGTLVALFLILALLVSCNGRPGGEESTAAPKTEPAARETAPQEDRLAGDTASEPGQEEEAGEGGEVSFTLVTGEQDGRIVYIGRGGEIDGQVNPDLRVSLGQVVRLTLENGDGNQSHNLVIDEFNVVSQTVFRRGQQSTITFKPDREGIFSYYSTIHGHESAGMVGRLIVGDLPDQDTSGETEEGVGGQGGTGQGNAEAEITFKLVTGMQEGKMVFIGSGGEIDGQVNPDLRVEPGQTVEIILVNGDEILHNVALETLGIKSEYISEIGAETSLTFTAGEPGSDIYFCDVPGHRQAGMLGRLIVGEPAEEAVSDLPGVALPPDELPGPLDRTAPEHIRVDLETVEIEANLADGTSYTFWTFNGTVPGPFVRARVGDTIEVHLKNHVESAFAHSVDFHAATGPGGGAVSTQTPPGGETTVTFKALNPGLYVYHCATPMVAHHITNGMYGLILVEPEGGLPPVDREFYVMQGELYTTEEYGQAGHLNFDQEKLLNEDPEYFIFNGAVGALTVQHPLQAQVGETIRIFFGVGGPNFTSSFHVIGEIFDRVYAEGSLTSEPLKDVQSTLVPTGGSVVVEFTLEVPGNFVLVDHSLSRAERGLVGYLQVEGPENTEIYDGETQGEEGH